MARSLRPSYRWKQAWKRPVKHELPTQRPNPSFKQACPCHAAQGERQASRMSKWRGVPDEGRTEWRQVFACSTEGPRLSAPCPLCGQRRLRRYFSSARPCPSLAAGFAGRGGSWEWCASCGAHEHAECLVPSWWQPMPEVREAELTAEPEELEVQFREAGHV